MVGLGSANVNVFAQQVEQNVPEPTRTIVLMALLGIILLGLLLIAFTMLGASWVRKQGFRRRSVVPQDQFLHREPAPGPSQSPSEKGNFSSAESFKGDDTVSNDDTVVS